MAMQARIHGLGFLLGLMLVPAQVQAGFEWVPPRVAPYPPKVQPAPTIEPSSIPGQGSRLVQSAPQAVPNPNPYAPRRDLNSPQALSPSMMTPVEITPPRSQQAQAISQAGVNEPVMIRRQKSAVPADQTLPAEMSQTQPIRLTPPNVVENPAPIVSNGPSFSRYRPTFSSAPVATPSVATPIVAPGPAPIVAPAPIAAPLVPPSCYLPARTGPVPVAPAGVPEPGFNAVELVGGPVPVAAPASMPAPILAPAHGSRPVMAPPLVPAAAPMLAPSSPPPVASRLQRPRRMSDQILMDAEYGRIVQEASNSVQINPYPFPPRPAAHIGANVENIVPNRVLSEPAAAVRPLVPVSPEPLLPIASTMQQIQPQQPAAQRRSPVQQNQLQAQPVNASLSTGNVVQGFGNDIPLAMAVQQIVPQGYSYFFGQGVNPAAPVSWNGGQPWNIVVANMVAAKGMRFDVQGNTISISKVN